MLKKTVALTALVIIALYQEVLFGAVKTFVSGKFMPKNITSSEWVAYLPSVSVMIVWVCLLFLIIKLLAIIYGCTLKSVLIPLSKFNGEGLLSICVLT